jgi:hypothetical protein
MKPLTLANFMHAFVILVRTLLIIGKNLFILLTLGLTIHLLDQQAVDFTT